MSKATIGRTVHFVLPGGAHRPAVITSLNPTEKDAPETVNLNVDVEPNDSHPPADSFRATRLHLHQKRVEEDPSGKREGSWHFAEGTPDNPFVTAEQTA